MVPVLLRAYSEQGIIMHMKLSCIRTYNLTTAHHGTDPFIYQCSLHRIMLLSFTYRFNRFIFIILYSRDRDLSII